MNDDELNVLRFKVSNLTTEKDVANAEIDRLKGEVTRWQKVSEDDDVVLAERASQLTAANTKFEHHIKHISQFLSDLYCTMIDPLVDGEMQVAPMMIALLDQAQKDREELSQLTAANAKVEKLREALTKVTEGRGQFSLDRFQHCKNTVADMKEVAKQALADHSYIII